jgi:hypothetical protein
MVQGFELCMGRALLEGVPHAFWILHSIVVEVCTAIHIDARTGRSAVLLSLQWYIPLCRALDLSGRQCSIGLN